jgi:hypothetical protein
MRPTVAQDVRPTGVRRGAPLLLAVAVGLCVIAPAQVLILGETPRAADDGSTVISWFREHADAVKWWAWLITVGAPLYATAIALLRRLLPPPHRDVFLIGAIGLGVTNAVQAYFWAGLALHADRLEPATARSVLDVAIFWGPVLCGQTVTMIAPVTLLALRRQGALPRWLGLLGLVVVVEQSIETVTVFGTNGFTEPGGAMNFDLGAVLVILWLLAFAFWGGLRGQQAATGP